MKKVIKCNYDPIHGHIKEYKMKQKETLPCKCEYKNTCQLNPLPSRYKETLHEKEGNTLNQLKYECKTIVKCTQNNCKNYKTDDCKHGHPHPFGGECLTLCERYPMQLCEPVDSINAKLCENGLVSDYNKCKECDC